MKKSVAPLIVAIVLLLLPVLYVGSYLALVVPGEYPSFAVSITVMYEYDFKYRSCGKWAERIYWPLEQIDRRLRPETWGQFPSDMRDAKNRPFTARGGKSAADKWSE